jgi:hypothetical protein
MTNSVRDIEKKKKKHDAYLVLIIRTPELSVRNIYSKPAAFVQRELSQIRKEYHSIEEY